MDNRHIMYKYNMYRVITSVSMSNYIVIQNDWFHFLSFLPPLSTQRQRGVSSLWVQKVNVL